MNEITYSKVGEYFLPDLTVPVEGEYQIGIWGLRRLKFLKSNRRLLYVNLLTSGRLTEHLRDIDATASEWREIIIRQMAAAQGATEQVKAESQMLWVGIMNNILACADEVIRSELIYD